MRKITFFAILMIALHSVIFAQQVTVVKDDLLERLLKHKDSRLDQVIANPGKYQFQLIYVRVIKEDNGQLRFEKRDLFQDQFYFNPASLIKLPLAVVAMEKLSALNDSGINIHTPLQIKTCSCDFDTDFYVNSRNQPVDFHQLLREMMIMSDNDAYNLFFDFVGMDAFNSRMKALGYKGTVMKKRFTSRCNDSINRISGGLRFYGEKNKSELTIPCNVSVNEAIVDTFLPMQAGRYYLENGWKISGPKDYSEGNYVRLWDATNLLMRLFYPEIDSRGPLQMNPEYRRLLIEAMGDYPSQLENSAYNTEKTPDNFYKFFLKKSKKDTEKNQLKIFNKVGQSLGFISDVAYVTDEKNGVSFFLAAAMLAKKSAIINDGNYNYNDFGFPVFGKIFEEIYSYELKEKERE